MGRSNRGRHCVGGLEEHAMIGKVIASGLWVSGGDNRGAPAGTGVQSVVHDEGQIPQVYPIPYPYLSLNRGFTLAYYYRGYGASHAPGNCIDYFLGASPIYI